MLLWMLFNDTLPWQPYNDNVSFNTWSHSSRQDFCTQQILHEWHVYIVKHLDIAQHSSIV